ncbi:MAG: MBL fold metallo-hydrolase [Bacteriovoracaceae bacterium]|nr:MBL fold metallo-hydrolase [Bacteriovoracaceae bacterium]
MSKIIDAVSVILVFKKSFFVIQRQNYLKSFPGYWAFPGGKVERDDEKYCIDHAILRQFNSTHIGAVIREMNEELGIEIDKLILNNEVSNFEYLGLAVTPDFNPYRFATHFYKITLNSLPRFLIDEGEVQFSFWDSGVEVLRKYEQGQMLVVPPVLKVFRELSKNIEISRIEEIDFQYDGESEVPMIENLKGIKQFMPLSHTLPPANRTNCFLIGEVLIDPSPCDLSELNKLLNTIGTQTVSSVFITHHHGDHLEHSNLVAKKLNVPLFISKDSFTRVTKKMPDFFEAIKVTFVQEGDLITHWLGQEVRAMAVPGHDEGQMALMPANRAWFLAGDLFQGVGTVVVGGDEGDMSKYMETLSKVIALDPAAVFPSHGIGLGGCEILKKTLEHRKLREEQILSLIKLGKSEEEILDTIYIGLDEGLRKYALKNIKAHLQKLKFESKY